MAEIRSPRETARIAHPQAHTMAMAAHSRAFGHVHTIFGFTPTGSPFHVHTILGRTPTGSPFELRITRSASSGV